MSKYPKLYVRIHAKCTIGDFCVFKIANCEYFFKEHSFTKSGMPDRSSFSFYQFFLDFIRRYVGKNMKRNNNQIKYIFHQKQKGFSLLSYEGIIDKIKHTFWLIAIMKRYWNIKRPFPVYQSQYDTFWVKNVSREVERLVGTSTSILAYLLTASHCHA